MYKNIIDIAKTENIIGEIGRAIDKKIEKTPTICISLKLCTDIKLELTVFLPQTSSIFKSHSRKIFVKIRTHPHPSLCKRGTYI
ncbi:MAG TPA: hypothetical protein VLH59_07770, partial [Ignavibacteriaceae bacterium]|nr:hypothetical protein [Ignavibacteriaceae bacterium]